MLLYPLIEGLVDRKSLSVPFHDVNLGLDFFVVAIKRRDNS
jgi:hypothetical protein